MRIVIFGLTVTSWGNGHVTLWRSLCRALGRQGHRVVFLERNVGYYARHRDLQRSEDYEYANASNTRIVGTPLSPLLSSPLVCSPWSDAECLFRPNQDYVVVPDGKAMRATLSWLIRDARARVQIAAQGLATVRERHTCQHRAEQLLQICQELER